MHLPDQRLAGFDSAEATLSSCGKTSRVPRIEQALRLEVQLTTGHVNVNERRIQDGDALAGFEPRHVKGGLTAVPAAAKAHARARERGRVHSYLTIS
jgi:hypothetical protein